MKNFKLLDNEELILQHKIIFDTLENSGLSEAEEELLEKEFCDCEYEMLIRMNKKEMSK